jgi:preprotein translocase subunit SecF
LPGIPVATQLASSVMFLGIIAGTYSSLWIASPALIEIRRRFGEGTANEPRKRAEATV